MNVSLNISIISGNRLQELITDQKNDQRGQKDKTQLYFIYKRDERNI